MREIIQRGELSQLARTTDDPIESLFRAKTETEQLRSLIGIGDTLRSRVLLVVNSATFGCRQPFAEFQLAIEHLGARTARSMILAVGLVDTIESVEGLDPQAYWQRCLFSAAVAAQVAVFLEREDVHKAFAAALLQDIGMVSMSLALGKTYGQLVGGVEHHVQLCPLEQQSLGFDHAQIGGELGIGWSLPQELVEAIRHHHDEPATFPNNELARIVALTGLAQRLIETCDHVSLDTLTRQANQWFAISNGDLKTIIMNCEHHAQELARCLDVKMGCPPNLRIVMAKAEESKIADRVRLQQETRQLKEANQQLAREASTDRLTGVGNRKHFDETLAERFQEASMFHGTLGLALVDADHFKSLNDTYGHDAGDTALVQIARRLSQAAGDVGVVARYGGEEFAVIFAGADHQTTVNLGENLRVAICNEPMVVSAVDEPRKLLNVTASLGVAVLDDATRDSFTTPEELVRAADLALYEAKEAGRNCVRSHRPSPTRA